MKKILVLGVILALLIRLFLINSAYHGDMNNNISWGNLAYERGLQGFYDGNNWPYSVPNQPPLTIFLFYILTSIWQLVEKIIWFLNDSIALFPSKFIWFWESSGLIYLYKFPSILADFGIGILIYKLINQITKDKRKAFMGLLVWMFNPIVIYNSAIWGQTDSIVNLMGLMSLILLLNRRLLFSLALLSASFLFKGSLAIFFPIFIIIMIKQKYKYKEYFKAIITSILFVLIISSIFYFKIDLPIWLFDLYVKRILPGEIGYLTANAFNFWWLIDSGKTYDSILFLGLSARIWGMIVSILLIIYAMTRLIGEKILKERIIMLFMITALITFILMTRIHERYMYPFFPYATIALCYCRKLIPLYIVLSLTYLINMYNLFWFPPFPILENILKTAYFPVVLSLINIFSLIHLLVVTRNIRSLI